MYTVHMCIYYMYRKQHHCLCPGLKLKIKSQSSGQKLEFDYVSAPFCSSLRSVDWTDLTTAEVTYNHIRLHQLKEEDSLGYFMTTMASVPAAQAIVLINWDNSYLLNKKTYPDGLVPPTSVLVVTKETGRELLRLVTENLRNVEAKFDLSPSPVLSAASPTCMVQLHIHTHTHTPP